MRTARQGFASAVMVRLYHAGSLPWWQALKGCSRSDKRARTNIVREPIAGKRGRTPDSLVSGFPASREQTGRGRILAYGHHPSPSGPPQRFNPLNYPLCLTEPRYLSDTEAWQTHIPFAFACVEMLQPRVFVGLGTHRGDPTARSARPSVCG